MLDNVLAGFHRQRAGLAWTPRATRRCASAPWAWARWVSTPTCRTTAFRSRARSRAPRTCACSSICAARRTRRRACWRKSAAPARMRPSAACRSASATSSRSRRPRASRVICGGTSACIEPIPANIYTHKTLSGSFSVRNPALDEGAGRKGLNTEDTWQSILAHEGSVQHLDGLERRREGRVPHGVRDRPALGHRARRRSRAAASARASR